MLLLFLSLLPFELVDFNGATFERDPISVVQTLMVDELVHQPLQFFCGDFLRIYQQIMILRSNLPSKAPAQKIGKRILFALQLAAIHFQLLPTREQAAYSPLDMSKSRRMYMFFSLEGAFEFLKRSRMATLPFCTLFPALEKNRKKSERTGAIYPMMQNTGNMENYRSKKHGGVPKPD